jgi:phosphotransferase system  glucose/maltose/N-acetylglucosamine-specific IIC component
MSSSSSSRPSRINLPLLLLWIASIVVGVIGYFLMTSSNAKEAAVYTAGKADYPKLFADQSGSTIGGLLLAVGVLGLLLALASHAIARAAAARSAAAVPEAADFGEVGDVTDEDDDVEYLETPAAEDAPGPDAPPVR